MTWETCTMRSWLNGYGNNMNQNGIDYTSNNFIDRAFTANGKDAILQKTVVNADNLRHGTEGGNNTTDKIFLLSIGEMTTAAYGFSSNYSDSDSGEVKNTAYTANKEDMNGEGKTDWYWLRSPGGNSSNAAIVSNDGSVDRNGSSVYDTGYGVRPDLRLNLTSNFWSYAGTVSSGESIGASKAQSISARSFTKTYGNKPFNLNAKAKTELTYKSSNTKTPEE